MQEIGIADGQSDGLFDRLTGLRASVLAEAQPILSRLRSLSGEDEGLDNLAHYLALRRHELREMQRDLMWHGLSSLGRIESRVVPTLDAVVAALAALDGRERPTTVPSRDSFFAGEARLTAATDRLFGPQPGTRRCRIMVTLPSEAADDPDFVADLAQRGMDVARINCAHDDSESWAEMVRHVRVAGALVARPIRILMEIAGPKIRTGAVTPPKTDRRVQAGDALLLVRPGEIRRSDGDAFVAELAEPQVIERLAPGQRVRYDDGKLDAAIESVGPAGAMLRVARVKGEGVKLKAGKGLNFPDTLLGMSPLTDKDERDLATIAQLADIVGYSFVSRPEDVDLLEAALERAGEASHRIGLIAKIEVPEAVRNLPDLIARAVRNRPFGVMIARGDLAAEIGFERLAEMQEEILWICEAAGAPAIWATQVLEDLVQQGVPSRGEMTDAAMASRAECVMLNKGPAIATAVELLDRLLMRMDAHMFKKTSTMRRLRSW